MFCQITFISDVTIEVRFFYSLTGVFRVVSAHILHESMKMVNHETDEELQGASK